MIFFSAPQFETRDARKEFSVAEVRASDGFPAASLTRCWDIVSSQPRFRACLEKLLGRR